MIQELISVVANKIVVFHLCLLTQLAFGQSLPTEHRITQVHIVGAVRTDIAWIKDYLDLNKPLVLTDDDLARLRAKLTTTDIFKEVAFSTQKVPYSQTEEALEIAVSEKWTTIPVMRGVYGGGTPLTVMGIYDTNGFGRLWTLGGEMHKYGDAPAGGVLWARAPRWQQGRHMLGFELWKDHRVRTIYDDNFRPLGEFTNNVAMARSILLLPAGDIDGKWQWGIDLKIREQRASTFRPAENRPESSPTDIVMTENPLFSSKVLATLVFDNIVIDGTDWNGQRLILNSGPIIGPTGTTSASEMEWFYYKTIKESLTVATHLFAGSVASHDPIDLYFLGGFDSIRGLPDGALHGNSAVFANFELRRLLVKFRYVWIQSALFSDMGNSSSETVSLFKGFYSTVGGGIRISFPYVYRLAFRIDYGISLNDGSLGGINAGMNDFFHPYRPL